MIKAVALSSALLAGALLALSSPVSGHAAAPPASYMTRVLGDYNDDWFGVQDGHNLVALDAYSAYDEVAGNDSLVLRLILSGGYARAGSTGGELSEVIAFTANGTEREVVVSTPDNAVFTATGATLRGPFQQLNADGTPDGDRFFVEVLVPFASLGVQPGDDVTGFFVTGKAGNANGDLMPQGAAPGYPDPLGTGFDIGTYILPGTDGFFEAAFKDGDRTVPLGGELVVDIDLTNLVSDVAQTVNLSAAAEGLRLSFAPGPADESATTSIDLAAGGSGLVKLYIARDPSHVEAHSEGEETHSESMEDGHGNSTTSNATVVGAADVAVEALSSLGGRVVLAIPLEVVKPAPIAVNATHHDDAHGDDKGTPAPGLALLVIALAFVVLRRRR